MMMMMRSTTRLEQVEREKALLQAKHRALRAQSAEAAREAAEREGQGAAALNSFVEAQRKLQADLEERQRTIRMQSKTMQTLQASARRMRCNAGRQASRQAGRQAGLCRPTIALAVFFCPQWWCYVRGSCVRACVGAWVVGGCSCVQ